MAAAKATSAGGQARGFLSRHLPSLLHVLLIFFPLLTQARDAWVNPGTMGANALPTLASEEPWTLNETQVWLGAAMQVGNRNDVSFTPTYRLVAPIGSWVTTYVEGMMIEGWWASAQTRREWALDSSSGWSKADIRVGAKLLLLDMSARGGPSVALRVMTKTTAGKSYAERRFTDAPSYLSEAIIGEHWTLPRSILLTLFGSIGFMCWQQGAHGQNDAVAANLALSARFFDRLTLRLEARGYAGWQEDDKVVLLSQRVMVDANRWLSFALTTNEGLLSAPRLEGRVDIIVRLPSALPLILGK